MNNGNEKRGFKDYCRIAFAGFTMGVANVIPGVSGGTMAFITGIFEEMVDAISKCASADTLKKLCTFKFRELYRTLPWKFLLALGVGIIIAFAGVTKLVLKMLNEHESVTFAFFLGLILASVVTVNRNVCKWKISGAVSCLLGAAVAYAVISLVPVSTPNVWWVSFLCGMIVICAMILPGISGSFLLLILGQYNYVWGAIGNFSSLKFNGDDFYTVLWLGLGALAGVAGFIHLLKYLFGKYHDTTIAALIGFMIGSVPRLWPWQVPTEWALKVGKKVINIKGIPDILPEGGSLTVLHTEYRLPSCFCEVWPVLLAALIGAAVVFAVEMLAAGKAKKAEAAK